jgi:hypothetical protein
MLTRQGCVLELHLGDPVLCFGDRVSISEPLMPSRFQFLYGNACPWNYLPI